MILLPYVARLVNLIQVLAILAVMILSGLTFCLIEGLTFVQGLYFIVVTMTTGASQTHGKRNCKGRHDTASASPGVCVLPWQN